MSVGFSVDFCVHICHAFISLDGNDRNTILKKAIHRAGGPVVNAAFSTLLGILMLAFSGSYIFQSFGILMFMVIGFGLIHAAFFLPLLLYVLLPCLYSMDSRGIPDSTVETKARRASSVLVCISSGNVNNEIVNGGTMDKQNSFTNEDRYRFFSKQYSSRFNSYAQRDGNIRHGYITDIGDGYKMYKPPRSF
jgi:multidrug efflux pump subunit AcrB